MSQQFEFRKVREVGDVLNGTFTFARQNWKPLGKAIFVYAAPFALLGGALLGMAQADLAVLGGGSEYQILEKLPGLVVNFSVLGIFAMAAAVMMTAVVYQYIRIYLENGGNEISLQELWEGMKANLAGYLGYLIVAYLLIIVGAVFCIIPGIYLAVPLTMIIAVKTFEQRPLGEAISRCFYLAKNYWWQTFLALLVVNIITSIAGAIVSVPFSIISTAVSVTSIETGEATGLAKILLIASSVVSYGVSSLLSVLTILAAALQYFNLVERKEGVGTMQQLEQLGKPAATNDSDFEETY
jgi:hypothetical protein